MTSITDLNKDEGSWTISSLLKGATRRERQEGIVTVVASNKLLREENKELRQTVDGLRRRNGVLTDTIAAHNQYRMETSMTKLSQTLPELPITLRSGFNVLITGLPADMTQEESDYIAGILYAYSQRPKIVTAEVGAETVMPISRDLDKSVQKDIDNGMAEAINQENARKAV